MKKQSYNNHARYYIPHHFIFYPIVFILFIFSLYNTFKYPSHSIEWMAIAALFSLMGWLSFMLRQHYSLSNQNRVVRLEMRLRYYQLTHKRFEDIESQLSFVQIAALRFASDEELVLLIQRTIDENLTPDTIKRSIINWIPDNMRI